ncbi:hypothetical protein N24_2508 [Corynebacterium suranareeae]|uniref:Uncharacterized protein n=1 Tax=Corynebacterium suranareeae TaxID=2506452 RepID=A0A160PVJ7_9CORY|nr:hypothetical protein N24_2508 [Corynebacterium suranareeae]
MREFFLWASPFAPFSTAFVAALAGIIAWRNYKHRRISDNRAEWWRRTQYAIDLITSDDDRIGRSTGLALLSHLIEDSEPTTRDLELIREVTRKLMEEILTKEDRQSNEKEEATSSHISHILKRRKKNRRQWYVAEKPKS